jgi:hypothetical protein
VSVPRGPLLAERLPVEPQVPQRQAGVLRARLRQVEALQA